MKISFFTQNISPFRMQWMEELSKYCEVNVYHVNEYVGDVNKKYISYEADNINVKDISRKFFGKKVFNLKSIFSKEHELILLDGYGFFAQQFLIIYLILRKMDIYMTLDGGFINKNENIIKKYFKKILLKKTKAFFSTSSQTDDFIRHYNRKAKIYRHFFSSVHNSDIASVEDIECKELYRTELFLESKFTILAIGKFIQIKGFDTLIKASNYLKGDYQILIIGGSDHSMYDYLIRQNNNKIHFIDFCEKDLLRKYYLSSDVFVMPSRGDVWGLVIGEAMSYGLPVITSDRCLAGIAMVEDFVNGFVFKVDDEKALASKIDQLHENVELCKRMKKNNLEKIKQYTIEEATKNDYANLKEMRT